MNAKPFIIGFIAVVAAIAAASIYMSATVERADKAAVTVVSPDGRLKAVRVTLSSKGPSPFCFDNIVVLPTIYPDNFQENRDSYEVYAAPCTRFADGAAAPKIEWLSATALQITTGKRAPNAKPPRTKATDVTKSVHVTFVERE